MNKKEFVFIIFGVLLVIALVGFVSAASSMADDFGKMFDEFSGVLGSFFSKILGESPDSSMFFQRCLILLIVYGIVYMVLGRISLFEGSPMVSFFVSSAVAILGVKFLSPDFIQSILLPYAALGGSIAIFLPYLIYFMFVHTSVKGTFGRKAAWIVFLIVFVGIFISKSYITGADGVSSINWFNGMYILGLIFVIFSIVLDKQVHMYFEYGRLGKAMSNFHQQEMRSALRDLRQLERDYRNNIVTLANYNRERKRLESILTKSAGQI